MPLSEDSSHERAYRHVKDAILNLQFKANAPLRAQSIATALSISRTPVREALSRLEQEGYVARAGGWGYVVKPVSLKDAMDLYKVREALEVEAVREAIPNIDAPFLERMRDCLRRAADELKKQRLDKFRDNTRDFHRAIASATGNTYLQRMLSQIDDRIRLLGALMAYKHVTRPSESLEENRAILMAIEAGDAPAAEIAVRKHVSTTRETLMRYVINESGRIII